MVVAISVLIVATPPGLGQAGVNLPDRSSEDHCWREGAVRQSAAQMKGRLRHMNSIASPLLYRTMRITDAVLSFELRADQGGNVDCIRAISGHPIIVGAAIESIRTWKFRPSKVRGQSRAIFGTLVLVVSGTERRLKTAVLKAEPRKRN